MVLASTQIKYSRIHRIIESGRILVLLSFHSHQGLRCIFIIMVRVSPMDYLSSWLMSDSARHGGEDDERNDASVGSEPISDTHLIDSRSMLFHIFVDDECFTLSFIYKRTRYLLF